MLKQDDIFLNSEGDNWYRRNAAAFNNGERTADWPLYLLDQYHIVPTKAIEVGCSGGWRLQRLKEKFNCKCIGVEPSAEAIEWGRTSYQGIDFFQGTAAEPGVEGSFDVVIVNFVLHWIDRDMLFRSLASIDRLVADNGFLIIGDFCPDVISKNFYHHLPAEQVFTYKQDYSQIFTASALYTKVAGITSHFDSTALVPNTVSDQRAMWSLLRKSKNEFYHDTTRTNKHG